MLPPYNLYRFRIDNKHMTELWLDQALMELAYKCDITVSSFVGNPVALLWLALFIDFLIQKKKLFSMILPPFMLKTFQELCNRVFAYFVCFMFN